MASPSPSPPRLGTSAGNANEEEGDRAASEGKAALPSGENRPTAVTSNESQQQQFWGPSETAALIDSVRESRRFKKAQESGRRSRDDYSVDNDNNVAARRTPHVTNSDDENNDDDASDDDDDDDNGDNDSSDTGDGDGSITARLSGRGRGSGRGRRGSGRGRDKAQDRHLRRSLRSLGHAHIHGHGHADTADDAPDAADENDHNNNNNSVVVTRGAASSRSSAATTTSYQKREPQLGLDKQTTLASSYPTSQPDVTQGITSTSPTDFLNNPLQQEQQEQQQQQSPQPIPPRNVNRSRDKAYTEHDIDSQYHSVGSPGMWSQFSYWLRSSWEGFDGKEFVLNRFPFVKALPLYRRSWIMKDLMTGITLGVILIPQSLAYTQLAGLPTSYGLYASFMPPLIYALLGTSRELSVGPFALVSLAVAQAIGQLEPSYSDLAVTDPAAAQALAVKVAMPLTLVVGLLTILMAVLQLGWVISFFSKPALSGFLVASAYTISTTQVASILQVRLASDSSFVESWTVIASAIPHANVASVLIGIVCVAVLLGMDYIFRPPRVKATIPWPLFVTIASILISYLGDFHYRYGVKVVGDVQASFPTPYFPTVPDVAQYIQAAVSLTMVNFVVAMSIVVEMASENGYAVDTNQETFALGCCGVVGSCFSAYVPAGSLSRSVVANKMKPGSTLWNLVLFAIIALCIAVLSPLLYHLPSATLAAIIIAAFKNMLLRLPEPFILWKTSPREAIVWAATFLVCVFSTTQWGILAAFVTSVGALIQDVSRPRMAVLGKLRGSRLYRDVKHYPSAKRYPEVLIFRFDSQLNFTNKDYFYFRLTRAIEKHLNLFCREEEGSVTRFERDNIRFANEQDNACNLDDNKDDHFGGANEPNCTGSYKSTGRVSLNGHGQSGIISKLPRLRPVTDSAASGVGGSHGPTSGALDRGPVSASMSDPTNTSSEHKCRYDDGPWDSQGDGLEKDAGSSARASGAGDAYMMRRHPREPALGFVDDYESECASFHPSEFLHGGEGGGEGSGSSRGCRDRQGSCDRGSFKSFGDDACDAGKQFARIDHVREMSNNAVNAAAAGGSSTSPTSAASASSSSSTAATAAAAANGGAKPHVTFQLELDVGDGGELHESKEIGPPSATLNLDIISTPFPLSTDDNSNSNSNSNAAKQGASTNNTDVEDEDDDAMNDLHLDDHPLSQRHGHNGVRKRHGHHDKHHAGGKNHDDNDHHHHRTHGHGHGHSHGHGHGAPARRPTNRKRADHRAVLHRLMTVKWRRELPLELKLAVVVSASGINSLDTSSLEMLKRLNDRKDILLLFAGLKYEVRRMLYISNVIPHASTVIFPDLHDAVTFGRACVAMQRERRRLQAETRRGMLAESQAQAEEARAAAAAAAAAFADAANVVDRIDDGHVDVDVTIVPTGPAAADVAATARSATTAPHAAATSATAASSTKTSAANSRSEGALDSALESAPANIEMQGLYHTTTTATATATAPSSDEKQA